MEESMKPNHLLTSEINYELRIRGVVTNREINERRKILGRLLNKERGRNLEIKDPTFDFDSEKDAITLTLENIKSLVNDFEGPATDSLFLRLRSRLIHATGRVKRIEIFDDANAESREFKDESYATCIQLEAELYERVSPTGQTIENNTSSTTFIPVPTTQPTPPAQIYKWGIKFDGVSKDFGVEAFVERVEEMAAARGVPKQDLFASAVDLFTGKGIEWWRYIKPSVTDWDSLVTRLRSDFLSRDNDEQLWKIIKGRKQRSGETVTLFIAEMESYFRRLSSTPAEVTKISKIRENLLYKIYERVALEEFTSVSDLANTCRRWEEVLSRRPNNSEVVCIGEVPPPSNRILGTDSGNNGSRNSRNFNRRDIQPPRRTQYMGRENTSGNNSQRRAIGRNNPPSSAENVSRPNSSQLTCWNCQQPNHTFRNCRLRRTKFCFKCGSPGATVSTCSGCSGNELRG